eukprot:scaffold144430_cov39-Prasinocladus_malaysianus.AAC.2
MPGCPAALTSRAISARYHSRCIASCVVPAAPVLHSSGQHHNAPLHLRKMLLLLQGSASGWLYKSNARH